MKYYFWTEKMGVGYHGQPLIENIEFGLEQGEILTLIGPNGAGKSTILKSIARQLDVINGSIWIGEKNLEYFSGKELSRNMAVLLTERLHTEMMTCEDVVATGRYPYTGKFGILSKADEAIVRESMEQVHILEIGDRDFTKISDGQRQRVMLARAICQEPDIIILDEPTSFLDVKYKLEFLSILQEMKRKKKLTVIMSLHELDLAQRISDKILCIDGKYADRFGTPEEVFTPGYITELFHVTAGCFEEEGMYYVICSSEDRAENTSDNRMRKQKIEFAVDRSGPEILLGGMEENGIYREKERTVHLECRDNLELQEVTVWLNGEEIQKNNQEEQVILLKKADKWQRIRVVAQDRAGNKTDTGEQYFWLHDQVEAPSLDESLKAEQRTDLKEVNATDEHGENRTGQSKRKGGNLKGGWQKSMAGKNRKILVGIAVITVLWAIFLKSKRHN